MATARPQRLRHASDGRSVACLLRLVGLAFVAVLMLAATAAALAAPMPNGGRPVSITAREQPIGGSCRTCSPPSTCRPPSAAT